MDTNEEVKSVINADEQAQQLMEEKFDKNSLRLIHLIFEMFVEVLEAKKYKLQMRKNSIILVICLKNEETIRSQSIPSDTIDVSDIHVIASSILGDKKAVKILQNH